MKPWYRGFGNGMGRGVPWINARSKTLKEKIILLFSPVGFSTGVSSSENSISSTPDPMLPHQLYDDIPTHSMLSSSHTKHSDTGH